MDKIARRVAARWMGASEIPQVIEKVVMEPRTVWVCPHCQQEIHEKAIYNDGTHYFHSAPTCRDKPMALVDGAQVGMITSLECKVSASSSLPEVRVAVLGGFPREAFERISPETKKSARETVAKLSRIPGVEVVCPDFLR